MTDNDTDKMAHARSNAMSWMKEIRKLVARMERSYDTCLLEGEEGHDCGGEEKELSDGGSIEIESDGRIRIRDIHGNTDDVLSQCDEGYDALRAHFPKFTGCKLPEYNDQDKALEEIQEGPLSVQISGTWSPGETPEADGFEILLSTGGPALRIKGDLGQWMEPSRAYLQMQDWGTPWTDVFLDHEDSQALLTYAQQFYFGG